MDMFDSCISLSPTPKTTAPSTTTTTTTATTTDDFMDATLNLPETQMKEGYKDGYKDGLTKGKQDAYEVGLKHGFECGEEVGFYRGLVDIWTAAIRIKPDLFSSRVRKSVEQLNELITEYPFVNPEDESKDALIDKMRLKFKAISATLGAKFEYRGYPKLDHAQDY
ncbi:hypothetical protein RND81_11G180300 [Saponaria officinalis]|uniref:Essential protein Yae1 N-terminal domain-containing protein n=1 Tax=Saponaria officinalis TaxID=3572 RepID=A0AAW1HNJ5_SAPOF